SAEGIDLAPPGLPNGLPVKAPLHRRPEPLRVDPCEKHGAHLLRISENSRPRARHKRGAGLAVLSAAALAVLGIQAPALATTGAPASSPPAHRAAAPDRVPYESVCGTAKPGDATCYALRRTDVTASKGVRPAAQTPQGWGASDLRSAYSLPSD